MFYNQAWQRRSQQVQASACMHAPSIAALGKCMLHVVHTDQQGDKKHTLRRRKPADAPTANPSKLETHVYACCTYASVCDLKLFHFPHSLPSRPFWALERATSQYICHISRHFSNANIANNLTHTRTHVTEHTHTKKEICRDVDKLRCLWAKSLAVAAAARIQ